MKRKNKIIFGIILLFILFSCDRFLDEKSDKQLAVPISLADNQALLDQDNAVIRNTASSGDFSSDDLFYTDADYDAISLEENKRLYTWQPDHVSPSSDYGNDWMMCYKAILVANTVLYNIDKYHILDSDNIKGQALALRASRYLDAAQIWCLAYNEATANTDQGLPLRLNPDMNETSTRSSLKQTYDQIINDLLQAIQMLPNTQISPTRISKAAALGLLARTYLYMGNYPKALQYAQEALNINNTLINYNNLKASDAYPIKDLNVEVVYLTTVRRSGFPKNPMIPNVLYNSFENDDLRKTIFFKSSDSHMVFKGQYTGSASGLSGIATNEIYLIAAECYARLNNVDKAMELLNTLLVTRWKNGTFIPFSANNSNEALSIILRERRKELLFRGIRWADLKRFNRDGANINLTKLVNGKTYVLPPNDLRYAIAIPEDIIIMTGMLQNKR